MLLNILLVFHLLSFLVLVMDLAARRIVLRRLGTPKEKLASTRRWQGLSKAPVAAAYVLLLITGGIMTTQLWQFTDAWILGGIGGYAVISGLAPAVVKAFHKTVRPEAAEWWARLGALVHIVFCMITKPSWALLPFVLVGFLAASIVLALAATSRTQRRWRLAGTWAGIFIAAGGLFWWQLEASKLPSSFSMMDYMPMMHTHNAEMVSVEKLVEPPSATAKDIQLTTKEAEVKIGGKTVKGWTYNGASPGPTLHAKVGERLRVTLANKLPVPTSIHWHGVVLPNSQDGVAGVTQDAVQPGEKFVYEFTPKHPGTYWYHSHQDPAHQVDMGLFGALVVDPATPSDGEQEVVAVSHTWHTGDLTVNGQTEPAPIQVEPGKPLRLRLVNSDSNPLPLAIGGAPFKVLAFDSGMINQPGELGDLRYSVAGAGRIDLGVTLAAGQELNVKLGEQRPVTLRLVTPRSKPADLSHVTTIFDPLDYGSASGTQDLPRPAKTWRLNIDEGPGFFNGRFGWFYTTDGKRFPHGPMLMVHEGQTYEVTFVNRSRDNHPMHLHGHLFQVMSIDGKASTGSPLMVDNINVAQHQTVTIRFTADNPGIWMAHCHNLIHAFDGMDLMVAYENVTTPYLVGGDKANQPE